MILVKSKSSEIVIRCKNINRGTRKIQKKTDIKREKKEKKYKTKQTG